MKKYFPVIAFVYSRPKHAKKMLLALRKNSLAKYTDLIIYSDGAKNKKDDPGVQAVRNYISTLTGFRSVTVVMQEKNIGFANSIIKGVTATVKKYGRVIVLEDDIETSPYFLEYMNDALNMYVDVKSVASISASSYPVTMNNSVQTTYLLRIPLCWGWATWENRWSMFKKDINTVDSIDKRIQNYINFDGAFDFFEQATLNAKGKLNTWFIFWYITLASKELLTLFPTKVMAKNIGHDGSGENCDDNDIYKNTIISNERVILTLKETLAEDKDYYLAHVKYFKRIKKNYVLK
ncbi:sugar transferase, partial [Salmonella enterica subsp. houtenae serovar 45:g,z51:-]|nr:sugar transferase [Salmonella enterica subsp. houtenae serovar 45:g,z51:-]